MTHGLDIELYADYEADYQELQLEQDTTTTETTEPNHDQVLDVFGPIPMPEKGANYEYPSGS